MLDRHELMRCDPEVMRDLPNDMVLEAGFDETLIDRMLAHIEVLGSTETSRDFSERAGDLAGQFAPVADLRDRLALALDGPSHFCVLRGVTRPGLTLAQSKLLLTTVVATVCEVSDNTAYSTHSGSFADEVRPSNKPTTDPTYQFDTEVHADESSKLRPEDVVALFAIRPAQDGGDSLIWPVSDVVAALRDRHGDEMLAFLRSHRFPFGGILRQPPRILRAPILFAKDGVRFRLGGIMDALQVLDVTPTAEEERALAAFVDAVRRVPPYRFAVGAGDGVVMLNRQTLHSRTVFHDPQRLLLRIRGNAERFSVTPQDTGADWSEELMQALSATQHA